LARRKAVESTVQSVTRAIQIIDVLVSHPEGVGVKELSDRLGLKVSTVHNLLSTLIYHGYAGQNPDGRYAVGTEMFQLASRMRGPDHLLSVTERHVNELGARTRETVFFGILRHGKAALLHVRPGEKRLVAGPRAEGSPALHVTAMGKALLSALDDDEREAYIRSADYHPVTAASITSPDLLRTEIERTRLRGYATNHGEETEGVNGIAVPVPVPDGDTAAGLCIGYPASRYTESYEQQLLAELRSTARAIAQAFGIADDAALDGGGERMTNTP